MGQLRRNAVCRGRPASASSIKSRHELPSSRTSFSRASCRRRPSCEKRDSMTQDDLLSFLVERMRNMPDGSSQRAVPQEAPSGNIQRNSGDVHVPRWETVPRYSKLCDTDKAQVENARQGEIGTNAGLQPCARRRPSKRMQRPKSADPHCRVNVSAYTATPSQSTQKRVGPEENAHAEPIAGAQWLEKLERRIERATNLAPGSLQTAVLLARPTDVEGSDGTAERAAPPRPSRPSSATHPSRPNSAARIRVRPSSAARPWSARTDKNMEQQQQPLFVVGAAHGARTFLTASQRAWRSAQKEKAQVDEEWKQLGVLEVDSQCDSEESVSNGREQITPDSPSWEKKLARSLGQKGSSRHPVSPVSARDPPSFF